MYVPCSSSVVVSFEILSREDNVISIWYSPAYIGLHGCQWWRNQYCLQILNICTPSVAINTSSAHLSRNTRRRTAFVVTQKHVGIWMTKEVGHEICLLLIVTKPLDLSICGRGELKKRTDMQLKKLVCKQFVFRNIKQNKNRKCRTIFFLLIWDEAK